MSDDGATSVLGAVLMMSLLLTLVPGAVLLKGAIAEELDAQREAAERAAFCARHPSVKPPTCPDYGPLPGYECEAVGGDAWVCRSTPLPEVPGPGVRPLMHNDTVNGTT